MNGPYEQMSIIIGGTERSKANGPKGENWTVNPTKISFVRLSAGPSGFTWPSTLNLALRSDAKQASLTADGPSVHVDDGRKFLDLQSMSWTDSDAGSMYLDIDKSGGRELTADGWTPDVNWVYRSKNFNLTDQLDSKWLGFEYQGQNWMIIYSMRSHDLVISLSAFNISLATSLATNSSELNTSFRTLDPKMAKRRSSENTAVKVTLFCSDFSKSSIYYIL